MYEITNKSKQELPVDIVTDGRNHRVFMVKGQKIMSDEITGTIERQKGKRLLRVKELDENDIDTVEFEENQED